jgi:hypothetical protein
MEFSVLHIVIFTGDALPFLGYHILRMYEVEVKHDIFYTS